MQMGRESAARIRANIYETGPYGKVMHTAGRQCRRSAREKWRKMAQLTEHCTAQPRLGSTPDNLPVTYDHAMPFVTAPMYLVPVVLTDPRVARRVLKCSLVRYPPQLQQVVQ